MTLIDIFRLLLIAQAGFTLGLTSLIILAYLRVWRKADKGRGLLPLHVVTVSVAHSMLVFFAATHAHGRIGEPITWRLPYLLAAIALSDAALIIILKLQVSRLRANDNAAGHVEATLTHDGVSETAVIVADHEPRDDLDDKLLPPVETYVTLRTLRALLLSVLALLMVVGLITVGVAFQVTRNNRMLDDSAKVRAQLVEQVTAVESILCGHAHPPGGTVPNICEEK